MMEIMIVNLIAGQSWLYWWEADGLNINSRNGRIVGSELRHATMLEF